MQYICTIKYFDVKSDFFQSEFLEKTVKLRPRFSQTSLNIDKPLMILRQIDWCLFLGKADIACDIQVVVVFDYLPEAYTSAKTVFFLSETISLYNLVDVLRQKGVLFLVFGVVLRSVDKEHVIALATFLQHDDAGGDTYAKEEVGW